MPVVDLVPASAEALRGEASMRMNEVSLTAETTRWVLVLLSVPDGARNMRLEITDVHDRVVWQASGLDATADGLANVILPSRLPPAGTYVLRLYGGAEPKAYALRIVGPAEGAGPGDR